MKNRPAKIATSSTGLLAVAFLIVSAIPIAAQNPLPRPPSDHTDPARVRFEETSRRELQLRNSGPTARKTTDPKQLAAVTAQVKLDFERILTLHNEVVRAITGSQRLDYAFVSDAAAEVKKRASRLQTTLALQKLDTDERDQQKQFSDAEVKDALTLLCRQIESFVKNPIIATPGTVDLQQLARARHDLASIIELGDHIKKAAERLKKANP
ncbi:MAG: hypothetical protein V7641_331 [Blastocatellia bacterium]